MIASHGMWGDLGGDWWSPFGWLGGLLALALTVAFWALVVLVIVKLVRNRPGPAVGGGSGLQILEERYARGEITRDEYLERRAVLSGESPPPSAL